MPNPSPISLHRWAAILFIAAASELVQSKHAYAASAKPHSPQSDLDQPELRERVTADLQSGNPNRIAAAVADVRRAEVKRYRGKPSDIQLLIDSGNLAAADSICIEAIIANANNTTKVTAFVNERIRVQQKMRDFAAALSSAKAYYCICPLRLHDHAVNLVAECLELAWPEKKDLVVEFRRQQISGAFAVKKAPSTHPAADISVLFSIKINSTPFLAALGKAKEQTYDQLVGKGNLSILCGDPVSARRLFEDAKDIAPSKQKEASLQNVARAIRASSLMIGPANEYLDSQSLSPGF